MADYLKYNHHINCQNITKNVYESSNQLSFCKILINVYWSAQVQVSTR